MIYGAVLAIIFSLISSLFGAGHRGILSKPLTVCDPRIVNYLIALTGLIIAVAMSLASAEFFSLSILTLPELVAFIAAGVMNFSISRVLSYVSIKHIGANQTVVLQSTATLYAFFLAVILLSESLSAVVLAGGVLIIFGCVLIEGRQSATKRKGNLKVGVVAALLSSLFYGGAFVIIKFGLLSYSQFFSAVVVSYAAGVMFNFLFLNPKKLLPSIRTIPTPFLVLIILSGIFGGVAQGFRFAALEFAPVVIVAPLLETSPIFVFLITIFLAKDFEVFQKRTVMSIGLVVLGAALVSSAS